MPSQRRPSGAPPASDSRPAQRATSADSLLAVYRAMLAARLVDAREQELVQRGEAFFHVSGAGHEAIAALAAHLTPADWLHLHYRDKALLIARGLPIQAFFDALLCRDGSPSRGRHMSAHLGDPSRNVLSGVGPVGNQALQAAGVAAAVRDRPGRPVVVCSAGEGSTQQGEYLEAVAEAVRRHLPVLFVVEDNGWAISTPTSGTTFASLPDSAARDLFGLPIRRADGRDPIRAGKALGDAVRHIRRTRGPAIVWLKVERLSDHTNADDHRLYRPAADLDAARRGADPLRWAERRLKRLGVSGDKLAAMRAQVEADVREAADAALHGHDPLPAFTAKAELPPDQTDPAREYRGHDGGVRHTLRDALRETLRHHLATDPRVTLSGQDIEDPKGDVFGVTAGLSTQFPGRVVNAALSESTIVGTAIGQALAGQRPVAFLQFADFLPLAFNQLASELGTIHWRTGGSSHCPVIVLATCGGYKPGLGPFHAQTYEATVAHCPGIDVAMPATAADAAGLLNAAFASPRPTVIFYPKAALNLRDGATSDDIARQWVPLGRMRRVRAGDDLTLVAWGNTVGIGQKAADQLAAAGIGVDLLDLRSLSPWDREGVIASAERTGRLLVVHEDNLSGGFGAEVVATVTEVASRPVRVKRLARPDVPVPCHFGNQLAVLPSVRSTVEVAAELLDLDLTWPEPTLRAIDGHYPVPAIGSGPADETVLVVRILVQPGDRLRVGDPVAEVEATKSTVTMVAPADGVVASVPVAEGDTIAVGQPVALLRGEAPSRPKPLTEEPIIVPSIRRRAAKPAVAAVRERPSSPTAFLGSIASANGSRVVSNAELLAHHPGRTNNDVIRRTGIESRRWVVPGEDALSLAVAAARQSLERAGLAIGDLDLIVCSTGSPPSMTPSLACRVLAELAGDQPTRAAAYDINAACAGYLYALQIAHDFLQAEPAGRALVVTSEVLSNRLDTSDFDTAFLFGDAATASVVLGADCPGATGWRLHRPLLSAKGDPGDALWVPLAPGDGAIRMKGLTVYDEAVRAMGDVLQRMCDRQGLTLPQIDRLVPHQANQRILDTVGVLSGRPVFSNIRQLGNTSSSSIPLALHDLAEAGSLGQTALVAFGGGFTFGAALLEG